MTVREKPRITKQELPWRIATPNENKMRYGSRAVGQCTRRKETEAIQLKPENHTGFIDRITGVHGCLTISVAIHR